MSQTWAMEVKTCFMKLSGFCCDCDRYTHLGKLYGGSSFRGKRKYTGKRREAGEAFPGHEKWKGQKIHIHSM